MIWIVKINKGSLNRIGLRRARGECGRPPHCLSITPNMERRDFASPTGRGNIYHLCRRKEDFPLAQQQAQMMENTTAQSMRNHHHLELFPPMKFFLLLITSSPHAIFYKSLPFCITLQSVSLLANEMLPDLESFNKPN